MKTRLELAEKYVLQAVKVFLEKDADFILNDIIDKAYEYADIMLAGDNKSGSPAVDVWNPRWELIPKDENWVAMDEDGGWRGYKTEPNICEKEKLWMTDDVEDYTNLNLMDIFNLFDGDWKDSLRKRPEGELK